MIRKIIIVVLTLAAAGMLTTRALTQDPEWAGGWSLRSASWLGNRFVVHHRCIVFAHDEVLPGQVSDPEYGARVSAMFRKAEKEGKLTPSKGIMEDSFMDSGFLGVRWGRGQFVDGFALRTDCWAVQIPIWMAFVLFAAYPTFAFIRAPLRRYRRRKRGLCVTCGYDLRGSPETCPECGKEINAVAE